MTDSTPVLRIALRLVLGVLVVGVGTVLPRADTVDRRTRRAHLHVRA